MTWWLIGALSGCAWVASGIGGFIWWWTSEYDLDTSDAVAAVFIGVLLGPFAWGVGWFVHSQPKPHRVLIARRMP